MWFPLVRYPLTSLGKESFRARSACRDVRVCDPQDLGRRWAGRRQGAAGRLFIPQGPEKQGKPFPVEITVYEDRSFTFITKTPPAAVLILKAAKLAKGSGTPNSNKVGKINRSQLEEIAKIKWPDLTAASMDAALRTIAGTARSMGVEVEGV